MHDVDISNCQVAVHLVPANFGYLRGFVVDIFGILNDFSTWFGISFPSKYQLVHHHVAVVIGCLWPFGKILVQYSIYHSGLLQLDYSTGLMLCSHMGLAMGSASTKAIGLGGTNVFM